MIFNKKYLKHIPSHVFDYKGKQYPEYLKHNSALQYIIPVASKYCKGEGLDIGGEVNNSFPNATIINITSDDGFNAYKLPNKEYDYIFSSHCLEHLTNYVEAIKLWVNHLRPKGMLFVYLPHPEMEYWLPQNNRKHLHIFHPSDIANLFVDIGLKNVFHSQRDLFWSFAVVGQK